MGFPAQARPGQSGSDQLRKVGSEVRSEVASSESGQELGGAKDRSEESHQYSMVRYDGNCRC